MKNVDGSKLVGVLALQGGFAEHQNILTDLGYESVQVRNAKDLSGLTHLIIPGGESTVMSMFLNESGLFSLIKQRVEAESLSLFGTCAGAIMAASKVIADTKVKPLAVIDIEVERNAYGPQINSFIKELSFNDGVIKAMFIRAPQIKKIGSEVAILCLDQGKPVLVRSKNVLVGTFHPELVAESAIHRYFMEQM